ncbi:uncharacterized protein OsI_031781-like [Miscanthus floridulus]|uniref:uncharacterized protein OsI_031781-like n=1 Tax=Miscanthus floridulus TaxID=154761 RepID=UPI003459E1E1
MAKILLLIVLVATITAVEATPPVPEQSSAEVDKKINEVNLTLKKVFDDVIASAPPAKKKEAIDAASKQLRITERALAKAKAGGEEKVATLALKYELSAKIVMEAPPAMKLARMEELFNAMAAPNHKDCATNIDNKPFCETISKLQKAFKEVRAAVTQGKEEETIDDVFLINQEFAPTIRAINKAYMDGDEKEIAAVLATYNKCADAILAAAPAEKFKVMQESIAAASRVASGKA